MDKKEYNKIFLKFPTTILCVAGREYGVYIYNTQVEDFIDYDKLNIIVFPKHIRFIADNFCLGFISSLVEKYNNISSFIDVECLYIQTKEQLENKVRGILSKY